MKKERITYKYSNLRGATVLFIIINTVIITRIRKESDLRKKEKSVFNKF